MSKLINLGSLLYNKRLQRIICNQKKSLSDSELEAETLIKRMTLDEKLKLLGGNNYFFTNRIKRLAIPKVKMADSTQGIRLQKSILGKYVKKGLKKTVAYPSPIMLASTWNKQLTFQYANCVGIECRAANIAILLGPGLNIYRTSTCGRNFEYFGEDPYLAGELAKYYVKGLQETGTMATLKHFIANNSEFYRRKSNSVVEERTLHEIYMPAFKKGIEAGAMAVMTSYNLVNGEWAGQSEFVIKQLLRKELGFKGLVMTDWWSVYDGEKVVKSGQDLEMPEQKSTKNLKQLLDSGRISVNEIERMLKNQIATFLFMHAYSKNNTKKKSKIDYGKLEETALQVAREGIVLLKNEGQILPLQLEKEQKILVSGEFIYKNGEGGGAAKVDGYNKIFLSKALKREFNDNIVCEKKPSEKQIAAADYIIFSVGTYDSEGWDRAFDLPEEQEQLLEKCLARNSNTIVVVNSGGGISMRNWHTKAAAIIFGWYWGQNGAIALAEILSGKINPSGKLPITIEKSFRDSPAYGYIPKGKSLYSGWKNAGEDKTDVFDINYSEGIFVGYRWYEHQKVEPLFPFGFGLSYTNFEFCDLKVNAKSFTLEDKVTVSFNLKNIGIINGSETAQLYIQDMKCSFPRPVKELKRFLKVVLDPGEERQIEFVLNYNDFSFWSPKTRSWEIEEGEFRIGIGDSSNNIVFEEVVNYLVDYEFLKCVKKTS